MDIATQTTETLANDARFGMKTRRLAALARAGYPVPPFVAFPSSELSLPGAERALADAVRAALPVDRYAIRSSALIEDSETRAHAGEFLTELAVLPDGLADAIGIVLDDARRKLGNLAQFSLLVQEYIVPDVAGVLFTRDPRGGLETIVEWRKGNGAPVVGGEAVERMLVVRGTRGISEPFGGFRELLSRSLAIEAAVNAPQDIEWAIRGGRVFIVQARPITSLSSGEHALYAKIEAELPRDASYFFAQSQSLEAFAHPTPLLFELLRSLFALGGPIDRTYRRFGIRRDGSETLRLFGAALYVDREHELLQFYPTHTLLTSPFGTPHFHTLTGSVRTLSNMFGLARAQASRSALLDAAGEVGHSIASLTPRLREAISVPDARDLVMRHYESVFLANFLSEKAAVELSRIAAEEGIPFSLALSLPADASDIPDIGIAHPDGLVGNSIDPSDTTPFIARPDPAPVGVAAWRALPEDVRKRIAGPIALARSFLLLRERARWLSVTLACLLRGALGRRATELSVTPELLSYADFRSIGEGHVDAAGLEARAKEFLALRSLRYPRHIASQPVADPTTIAVGVSMGTTEGFLMSPEMLAAVPEGTPVILLSETLSPEIVAHFPRIVGVVSSEGGILSHAAVTAREFGIPVVVAPDIALVASLGDRIRIDGTSGAIDRV
ncbi:MAG TPA: PEP/pyruvate-binding domain-containing protein [Candidatus Paceibacterota bacterium]|nr:PEP/pyruvate-binding domain-containing protein [Candidatus Paceibacterota bacterium]